MLSLERTKELLNDPGLTDEEIREIRDGFYELAQIIFEQWKEDRKAGKLNGLKESAEPLNKTPRMPQKAAKSATLL